MELKDIYNSVENPLDDLNVIQELVDCFYKSTGSENYYDHLIKLDKKAQTEDRINHQDEDKYYATLGNTIKNNFINHCFDQKYKKTIEYLKGVKDITSKKEYFDLFVKSVGITDPEIKNTLHRLDWISNRIPSSYWIHFKSDLLLHKDRLHSVDVQHRFYFNTSHKYLFEFLDILVNKLEKNYFPYYFKYTTIDERDDNVVVYCKTDDIPKYLKIFEEIKKEHPDLVAKMGPPPAISSKIDGWFGYGSEPDLDEYGAKQSFNESRIKVIRPAISKVLVEWVTNNKNSKLNYNGKEYSVADLLVELGADAILKQLTRKYDFHIPRDKSISEAEAYRKELGYNKSDLENPHFKDYIKRHVSEFLNENPNIFIDRDNNIKKTINLKNSQTYRFDYSDIYKAVKNMVPYIKDESFLKAVQKEIKDNCLQKGIDPDNFSFDIRYTKDFKKEKNVTPKPVVVDDLLKLNKRQVINIEDADLYYYSKYLGINTKLGKKK